MVRTGRDADTTKHIGITGAGAAFTLDLPLVGSWQPWIRWGIGGYHFALRRTIASADQDDGQTVMGWGLGLGVRRSIGSHDLLLAAERIKFNEPFDTRDNAIVVSVGFSP